MALSLPRRLLGGALALGAFAAVTWLEHRNGLRREVEPKGRHALRNVGVAGAAALTIQLAERPVVEPLTRLVDRRRLGLLPRLGLPRPLEGALAVVAMDYTFYWWHVGLHRVPWLWRFHAAHHADLDLDVTTAIRWHFGELVASVPYRAAQVLLIGVRPGPFRVWAALTMLEVAFHHANLRLPIRVERWLSRLLVTPRLHGIHHSVVAEETGSNYSSGLAVWDYLHGTRRANVPQQAVTIGVAAYRDPAELTLPKVLAMPFGPEKEPMDRLPDGTRPERAPTAEPADRLLP